MSKKILVSLVITARNDNYTEGFIRRLIYTVNYNLEKVEQINLLNRLEIIIIDWGSKLKISEIFELKKNKYKNKVKFFYVKEVQAKKYGKGSPGNMFQELIMNCGLRRSNGVINIIGTHDVVYSLDGWSNIFRVAQNQKLKNNFFWIPKKNINTKFHQKSPSFKDLDKYLENFFLSKVTADSYSFYSGGGASSLMFSAQIKKKIYGLSQNLPNKGRNSLSDHEIVKKAAAYVKIKDGLVSGIIGYKFPQSKNKNNLKNIYRKQKLNEFYFPTKITNKNYGLKNLKLDINYAKLINKELYILNSKKNFFIEKNKIFFFEKFLFAVKTYINTVNFPINIFNSNILKLNKFLIDYIESTRTFNVCVYGLRELNILAALCKNFSFLNIQLLENEKENNSTIVASKLKKINQYYNQNHKSHYNYIYTKNNSIILNFIKKISIINFSTVVIINSINFSKVFVNKLIYILNKQSNKISLIILKKEKNINYKKINNFRYICELNEYVIYLNRSIAKYNYKENKIENFLYFIVANISFYLGLVIKSKYFFKKFLYEKIFRS